jgi:hypothetical protein
MARVAYIAEIDPREVAALGYLAGMLQGQGIAQGQVLAQILDRIQLVEVPDDFAGVAEDAAPEQAEQAWEGEGGTVLDFPSSFDSEVENSGTSSGDVLPENAFEVPGGELPAIDVANDPTAPENLGIELNKPNPYGPPPVTQFANQEDFGAGPPPRD